MSVRQRSKSFFGERAWAACCAGVNGWVKSLIGAFCAVRVFVLVLMTTLLCLCSVGSVWGADFVVSYDWGGRTSGFYGWVPVQVGVPRMGERDPDYYALRGERTSFGGGLVFEPAQTGVFPVTDIATHPGVGPWGLFRFIPPGSTRVKSVEFSGVDFLNYKMGMDADQQNPRFAIVTPGGFEQVYLNNDPTAPRPGAKLYPSGVLYSGEAFTLSALNDDGSEVVVWFETYCALNMAGTYDCPVVKTPRKSFLRVGRVDIRLVDNDLPSVSVKSDQVPLTGWVNRPGVLRFVVTGVDGGSGVKSVVTSGVPVSVEVGLKQPECMTDHLREWKGLQPYQQSAVCPATFSRSVLFRVGKTTRSAVHSLNAEVTDFVGQKTQKTTVVGVDVKNPKVTVPRLPKNVAKVDGKPVVSRAFPLNLIANDGDGGKDQQSGVNQLNIVYGWGANARKRVISTSKGTSGPDKTSVCSNKWNGCACEVPKGSMGTPLPGYPLVCPEERTWATYFPSEDVPDGPAKLHGQATDLAGNVGKASKTQEVFIDRWQPTTPQNPKAKLTTKKTVDLSFGGAKDPPMPKREGKNPTPGSTSSKGSGVIFYRVELVRDELAATLEGTHPRNEIRETTVKVVTVTHRSSMTQPYRQSITLPNKFVFNGTERLVITAADKARNVSEPKTVKIEKLPPKKEKLDPTGPVYGMDFANDHFVHDARFDLLRQAMPIQTVRTQISPWNRGGNENLLTAAKEDNLAVAITFMAPTLQYPTEREECEKWVNKNPSVSLQVGVNNLNENGRKVKKVVDGQEVEELEPVEDMGDLKIDPRDLADERLKGHPELWRYSPDVFPANVDRRYCKLMSPYLYYASVKDFIQRYGPPAYRRASVAPAETEEEKEQERQLLQRQPVTAFGATNEPNWGSAGPILYMPRIGALYWQILQRAVEDACLPEDHCITYAGEFAGYQTDEELKGTADSRARRVKSFSDQAYIQGYLDQLLHPNTPIEAKVEAKITEKKVEKERDYPTNLNAAFTENIEARLPMAYNRMRVGEEIDAQGNTVSGPLPGLPPQLRPANRYPSVWTIHNYYDLSWAVDASPGVPDPTVKQVVNKAKKAQFPTLNGLLEEIGHFPAIRDAQTQTWVTETGVLLNGEENFRGNVLLSGNPVAQYVAGRAFRAMHTAVKHGAPLTRLYYYGYRLPNGPAGFDSFLIDAAGKDRPAFCGVTDGPLYATDGHGKPKKDPHGRLMLVCGGDPLGSPVGTTKSPNGRPVKKPKKPKKHRRQERSQQFFRHPFFSHTRFSI